ncbi:putative protein kinase superfamily protein [Panicum miliaceum]|uniref:Uncharacterized protein n=1 Tax=Panicum miliaceum TaxID=4540 RepID=A0A3L6TMG0_PANMI|nr:putative protein kinase superfamily protein [Panicum miliaceum]
MRLIIPPRSVPSPPHRFVEHALSLVECRKWEHLADPRLARQLDTQQLRTVVEAAMLMLCTQSYAESRPAMAEVIKMLRFSGERRTTKEIVPVVAASSEEVTNLDDVTGSSEPLDSQSWKLTKLRFIQRQMPAVRSRLRN